MVVGYKERRYFRDPCTHTLKLTKEEQNTLSFDAEMH